MRRSCCYPTTLELPTDPIGHPVPNVDRAWGVRVAITDRDRFDRTIADCADLAIVPMSSRNPVLRKAFGLPRSEQSKVLTRSSGRVIMRSPSELIQARGWPARASAAKA
jgi:hypothetical protein